MSSNGAHCLKRSFGSDYRSVRIPLKSGNVSKSGMKSIYPSERESPEADHRKPDQKMVNSRQSLTYRTGRPAKTSIGLAISTSGPIYGLLGLRRPLTGGSHFGAVADSKNAWCLSNGQEPSNKLGRPDYGGWSTGTVMSVDRVVRVGRPRRTFVRLCARVLPVNFAKFRSFWIFLCFFAIRSVSVSRSFHVGFTLVRNHQTSVSWQSSW